MGCGFAGAVRTLWKLPRLFCFSFFVPIRSASSALLSRWRMRRTFCRPLFCAVRLGTHTRLKRCPVGDCGARCAGGWAFSGKGSTSSVSFASSLKKNNLNLTVHDLYRSLAAEGQSVHLTGTTSLTGSGSADTWDAVMPNIEEAILDLQQSMEHFSNLKPNNDSLEPSLVEIKSTNEPSIPFVDYAPVRCVGGGTHGKTMLVQNRHSGQYYAMKVSV